MSLNLSAAPIIDDNDVIPPSPPWWEYFTIHGVDVDKDGVRDDVELWINKNYNDMNLRKALKGMARAYKDLLEKYDNKNEYKKLSALSDARSYCIKFVVPDSLTEAYFINEKLENKILNNIWRKYIYKKGLSNIPSGSYRVADVSYYQYVIGCDFKVNDPEKLMRIFLKTNPRYEWDEDRHQKFKDMYENYNNYDATVLFSDEQRS